MGAQESSRRVTVANENDDTIGVVKISEELLRGDDKERPVESHDDISKDDVKQLWQELLEKKKELDYQQERINELLQGAFDQGRSSVSESGKGPPWFTDENLHKRLEEKQQELDEIRQRTKFYQEDMLKKNEDVEKAVLQEFDNAVNEMQGKYSDKKMQPVCTSLQNAVLDCYKENKNSSLKCSQLVRDYVNCVEQARKSMVQTLKKTPTS